MYEANVIPTICNSSIWDEKADAMTDIVQLGAIGVVKHLCNGHGAFVLSLPYPNN